MMLFLCVDMVSAEPAPRKLTLLTAPAKAKSSQQIALIDRLIRAQLVANGSKRYQHSPLFDPTALTDARSQLEASRKAMATDHNLARAEIHELAFNRALLAFRGALAEASLEELTDVHLAMAATRLKDDDRRLAADYLSVAMHLRPDLTESDFLGQNAVRDLFRELRSEWSSRETGAIFISSKRKGVEVYRNDDLVGYTPLNLPDIPVGSHLIRLKRDGFYSTGQFVTVRANQPTNLSITLKPVAGRSTVDRALKLINKKRWPKDEGKIQSAVADIKRVLTTEDVVILTIGRSRRGFNISGAVAVQDNHPKKIKVTLAADSRLLTRVKALVDGWFVIDEIAKPQPANGKPSKKAETAADTPKTSAPSPSKSASSQKQLGTEPKPAPQTKESQSAPPAPSPDDNMKTPEAPTEPETSSPKPPDTPSDNSTVPDTSDKEPEVPDIEPED